MVTEQLPTKQVHDEVDLAEWHLRQFLVNMKDPRDVDMVRYLVAKLKYLTWATLVQGPEVPEDQMVLNWPDMDWFENQAQKWDEEALCREITELIPRYIAWLSTVPNLTKRPGPEVWRRFALRW